MSDKKYVTYEEFGAVGDGAHEDYAAIYRAHEYANENGLPVKAKDGAIYYIRDPRVDGEMKTAIIKTDVDWGTAKFIIDDTDIRAEEETGAWRNHWIFKAASDYEQYKIEDEATLAEVSKLGINKKSTRVALKLGYPALIIPVSSGHKVFRRLGYTGCWKGSSMQEILVIDGEGNISEETPVMFDYEGIDYITVIRLDIKPITITGGEFNTLACTENLLRFDDNGRPYYVGGYIGRGLAIHRSYTTVKGVKHIIKGELPMSKQVNEKGEIICVCPPYGGFFQGEDADHITFEDCVLSGRRCYNYYTGGACGTYGLAASFVNKIVFKNCKQHNFWVTVDENHDIHPATEDTPGAVTSMSGHVVNGKTLIMHWGIGGTNFCKNMEYIDCLLSRFDAHCGLYHGKIVNSTINGLEVVGHGTLTLENSRLFGRGGNKNAGAGNSIFYLRDDYASTWDGEMIIKNLDIYEKIDENTNAFIFCHTYNNWYYGYQAKFPNLYAENLRLLSPVTREQYPAGTEIHLVGNSLAKEPMMHAEKTSKCPAIFPDVDEDGDGLVDGTDIPYDDEVSARGVTDPTNFKNHNPVLPPKYIKILSNKDYGYKYVVLDTSEYEDGGFFGKTEFVSDGGAVVGTANKKNDTFKFEKMEA